MKRNSPKQIQAADDLNNLEQIITDKRNNKRADAKKHRRNRHYQKQFIRNALSTGIVYKNEESNDE